MAEAFLRHLAGDLFEVASAGTETSRVHPLAIRVMAERGIALAGHDSKLVDPMLGQSWDVVITVCDAARERCPVLPRRTRHLHWSVEDPTRAAGPEKERLAAFRRVRDRLERRIRGWLARGH
jgi:arsenate reductase